MRRYLASLAVVLMVAVPVLAAKPADFCAKHPTNPQCSPRPTWTANPAPTASPIATVVLVPTPTAQPSSTAPAATATAQRPFPAPVTSRTVQVTGDPNTAIRNAADGTVLEFSGDYSLPGLAIVGKSNLVLDGNGHVLYLTGDGTKPDYSAFFLRGSHDIAIRDFMVVGPNPNTTTIFNSGQENAHVLALSGWYGLGPSWNVEISGTTASHIYGDGAYLEGRNTAPYEPSHDVWVHDNSFDYIGRNCLSSIDANDVLFERNSCQHVGMDGWDIEPNFTGQQVRRNVFRDNAIGTYSLMTQFEGWLLSTWNLTTAPVSDVTVAGNSVVGNPSSGHSGSRRGLNTQLDHSVVSGVWITDNSTSQPAPGPVVYCGSGIHATVTGNVQPLTSGSFTNCTP